MADDSITKSPLTWPLSKPRTQPGERRRGRFGRHDGSGFKRDLSIAEGRERVLGELRRFAGGQSRIPSDSIIISTNLQLRLDGLPRSGQRPPEDPGVAVYFRLDGEAQCIPCDVYDQVQDNMAAIADCLGSLRTLERHDAGMLRAAFSGFAQLMSPEALGRPHWRTVLATDSHDPQEIRLAYRRAAKRYHPDHGGSPDDFHRVQTAVEQARAELGIDHHWLTR